MRKLSVGQRKALSEFFTNGAVAWLSAGIITPFFVGKSFPNVLGSNNYQGSKIMISQNLLDFFSVAAIASTIIIIIVYILFLRK